jgi:hypothetical protein
VSVAILLMNKLYEEKQFDMMVQVYKQLYSKIPRISYIEITELLLDALVEQVWFMNSF